MSNPAIVALLAWLWMREPLRLASIGGILVSMVGVVLVARPAFVFGGDPWTRSRLIGEGVAAAAGTAGKAAPV